jgi:hypothetical protein
MNPWRSAGQLRRPERQRSALVEPDAPPAHQRPSRVERRGAGERAAAARLAPQGDERPDGGVERAVRDRGDRDCLTEQSVQLGADLDPLARPRRQPVHLAPGPPVTHHVLEGGDPREGGTRRHRRRRIVGVKDDPGGDAEVQLGELVARGLGASSRTPRQPIRR